jgi:hypothetical protein
MKKVIRYDKDGIHVLGSVNAAVVGSEGAKGTHVSSRQRVRVVQRNGETIVSEVSEEREESEKKEGGSPNDG